MKRADSIAVVVCVAVLSASVSSQSSEPTGLTPLFDGKTLSNWVVADGQYAQNFSVRDGLLRVEGTGGWLRSAKQYSDFTLRVEFRYLSEDPGGRSGVSGIYVRTPATTGTYGTGWPGNSVEVQLSNRTGSRTAAPGDPRWGGQVLYHDVDGGPVTFDTQTALRTYGTTGEWQTHEIQVIGGAITVLLNDRFLGRAYAGLPASGYIGLQAETGAIEFRSILIKEGAGPIPARSWEGFVPIFDGKTLNGWKPANPESKTFSIKEGGVLSVTGRTAIGTRGGALPAGTDPGGCMGNLFTEKEYSDFTLRFEARFSDGLADSGFLTRVPPDGGAYQIQLQGMGTRDLPWNALLFRQGGVPQGETTFDYNVALKAYSTVGDWTTYEVQAFGPSMTVKMNGLVVARAENVGVLEGKFGFQCEVNTVDLRNIQVREGM
jgi:hypothetical protein